MIGLARLSVTLLYHRGDGVTAIKPRKGAFVDNSKHQVKQQNEKKSKYTHNHFAILLINKAKVLIMVEIIVRAHGGCLGVKRR